MSERAGKGRPCQGRCEFHGRLWCKEFDRSCEEYMTAHEEARRG